MANPKTNMLLPAENSDTPCSETQRLRASITRLEQELAARQAEARALPSSVMRAYQALIDKQYAQLASLDPKSP